MFVLRRGEYSQGAGMKQDEGLHEIIGKTLIVKSPAKYENSPLAANLSSASIQSTINVPGGYQDLNSWISGSSKQHCQE